MIKLIDLLICAKKLHYDTYNVCVKIQTYDHGIFMTERTLLMGNSFKMIDFGLDWFGQTT